MNNKGFAVSTFMYMILLLAIILILATLAVLSSRRMILDKQKNTALENIDKYNSLKTEQNIICESLDGVKSLNKGTEYTCEVKEGVYYNFYVLGTTGTGKNEKANLIMSMNLCNNGTTTYTSKNNYCRYHWHTGEKNNNYGPDTAMQELYEATKDWNNIPNLIMNYSDENNSSNSTKGYATIITDSETKITTITGKNGASSTDIGTTLLPLKARLPEYNEVNSAGCTGTAGSCPAWLVESLQYYSAPKDKYSNNSSNTSGTDIYNIYGYWLLSSQNNALTAFRLGYGGNVTAFDTNYSGCGVRPVITLPKSMLK